MMPWKECADKRCRSCNGSDPATLHQILTRDDDRRVMGSVLQFIEGHAFYPVGPTGRFGPHSTLEAARAAVEAAVTPEQYNNRK